MPDAAQFTFNLFDNTALGWTVPIPAPDEPDDHDADAAVTAPTPTLTRTKGKRVPAANYRLDGDRALARG